MVSAPAHRQVRHAADMCVPTGNIRGSRSVYWPIPTTGRLMMDKASNNSVPLQPRP